jgi:hypothetical protein
MRRLLLSFALAVSLSALGASSALAQRHHHAGKGAAEGAQKAPLYGPHAELGCTGGAPTPQTFGFVVWNTPGDETTLTGEVALKHAAPNATFQVSSVQQAPLTCAISVRIVGTLTTSEKGNGNLRFTEERIPGSTTFFVEIINVNEDFITPAVELD